MLVVAVDGTWQAANRMATKYPQHVHHVRLPPEAVLPSASTAAGAASQQPQPADDGDDNANADAGASSSSETASCAPSAPSLAAAAAVLSVGQQPNGAVSLLAPVRRYKGDVAGNGRVSTCEAAAALLALLEGPQRGPQLQDALLQNMKVKVDGTRLQAGKEQAYYTH